VLERDDIDLVFEATSAAVHKRNAPAYAEKGVRVIDLTPSKLGVPVVPAVNGDQVDDALNLSLISCGAQATVPIVASIASVCDVRYAEIVATIASLSAGPGTRQNIDEFTRTTASALETVGRAEQGKAIIILNPAFPPIHMRNTVFAVVDDDGHESAVRDSVLEMGERVATYVPGYKIVAGPEFDPLPDGRTRVGVSIEVSGAGDYLPTYAGNLDIITAAAVGLAERIAS
jgi:acetaldehyde dehydrogenase